MKYFFIRIINMVIGIALFALGIVITIKAHIGYAPWEVFHVGLADTTGLSIGVISIIVGIVLMIIVTILGEELGLGTVSSIFLTGIFIDLIIFINFIPIAENILQGSIMMIIGLFAISIATYFYIKSAFGVGPRDNLMVVLARKTKIPVGICRSIVELSVTVTGWFLGGMVGFGTVFFVIAIGFCIQITFRLLKFDVTAIKHESLKDTFYALVSNNK